MGNSEIFNFRQIDDRLVTAGQPSEEQLGSMAAEGFEVVINIAPIDRRYSLALGKCGSAADSASVRPSGHLKMGSVTLTPRGCCVFPIVYAKNTHLNS